MKLLLRNSHFGTAVLEAALTLPIVLYMIFFIIESIQINAIQEAIDAAAVECSFDFMSTKCDNEFAKIVKKHFLGVKSNLGLVAYKSDNVSWTVVVYEDFNLNKVSDTFTGKPGGNFNALNDMIKGKPFILTFTYKHHFVTGYIKSKIGKTDSTSIKAHGVGVCN